MVSSLVNSRLHFAQSGVREGPSPVGPALHSSFVPPISTFQSKIPILSGLLTSFSSNSSNIPTFKPANVPTIFRLSPLLPVTFALFCPTACLYHYCFQTFTDSLPCNGGGTSFSLPFPEHATRRLATGLSGKWLQPALALCKPAFAGAKNDEETIEENGSG
jgi:hypothetical protein